MSLLENWFRNVLRDEVTLTEICSWYCAGYCVLIPVMLSDLVVMEADLGWRTMPILTVCGYGILWTMNSFGEDLFFSYNPFQLTWNI